MPTEPERSETKQKPGSFKVNTTWTRDGIDLALSYLATETRKLSAALNHNGFSSDDDEFDRDEVLSDLERIASIIQTLASSKGSL